MIDYKAIFDALESTLISVGSQNLAADKIKQNLDFYRHLEGKKFSDEDYYWILVYVIFYSGFRAATVTSKIDLIRKYFPSYESVAAYGDEKIAEMLGDARMIRNRRKIQSCVDNARALQEIVGIHGSFENYVNSFDPTRSWDDLMNLKEELEHRFRGIGRVTSYHVLTDIGLPVLKPDRVISRIFERLGLVEADGEELEIVIQGRRFADATGHPIRYIDIVFVAYGQMQSVEFGIEKGICLEKKPTCSICGITAFCKFYVEQRIE